MSGHTGRENNGLCRDSSAAVGEAMGGTVGPEDTLQRREREGWEVGYCTASYQFS